MQLTALIFIALSMPADTPTWPQWRGPSRDGFAAPGTAWPDNLKALETIWAVENLGPSYSGPIVGPDRVYITETRDKKQEVVIAYDRATGKQLWTQQWDGSMTVPFFANANGSWIRSTPALSGDSLYVAGIRDKLVCLNSATGEIRWTFDFMKEFQSELPTFGCVCSPLVDGSGVYIQAGGATVKLDAASGKVIWKSLADGGGMMGSAFASPVLGSVNDQQVLLVQTRTKLAGLKPDDGTVLFEKEIPSFRGMNILTPTPFENALFTSTYGGSTQLIKLLPSGDGLRTEDAWKFKYEGNMTSPVVIDGHAYLLGKDQKFICVDLKAGKEKWRSERSYGKYWSLVANGNRILALDQRGMLLLIQANPDEFQLQDQKKLRSSDTWAHLAVAGDEVFIRDLNGLTSHRWGK